MTQAERFLNSDMTVKEWCACIGKHSSTMYRWMARLAEERPEVFGVSLKNYSTGIDL